MADVNNSNNSTKRQLQSCCFLQCHQTDYHNDPNATYHEFPSSTALRKKWINNISAANKNAMERLVVCGQHFTAEDYADGSKRLKNSAVPSVFKLYPASVQQPKKRKYLDGTSQKDVPAGFTSQGKNSKMTKTMKCKPILENNEETSQIIATEFIKIEPIFDEDDLVDQSTNYAHNIFEPETTITVTQDEYFVPTEECVIYEPNEQAETSAKSNVTIIEEQASVLMDFSKVRCKLCGRKLYSFHSLFLHFTEKHKDIEVNKDYMKKDKCKNCKFDNYSLSEVLLHLKSNHDSEYMIKKVIDYTRNNINFQHKLNENICKICGKTCSDMFDLHQHLLNVHYYCAACFIAHKTNSSFNKHKIKHSEGNIKFFKCNKCNNNQILFRTFNELIEHTMTQHNTDNICFDDFDQIKKSLTESVNDQYDCPYCGVENKCESVLKLHVNLHEMLTCDKCKCKFIIFDNQSVDLPKNCAACEQNIIAEAIENYETNKSNLYKATNYASMLTEIKDIPCIFCNKFNGTALNVYVHSWMHEICRICMIVFHTEDELKQHKQQHKNGLIKSFQCMHCKIVLQKDLSKHICTAKRDQGEDECLEFRPVEMKLPFVVTQNLVNNTQCPFCQSLISNKLEFLPHLKAKHNIKSCPQCQIRYVAQADQQNLCRACKNHNKKKKK